MRLKSLKQEVDYDLVFQGDAKDNASGRLPGCHSGNLQSKMQKFIKELLTKYSLGQGATLTFKISPAEPDEFARPDPE